MKNDTPDRHPDHVPPTPAKPMVVRCSHCNGLMRVDQGRIRGKTAVRLRCPHCRGVGIAPHLQTPERPSEPGLFTEKVPGVEDRTSAKPPTAPQPRRRIPVPRDPSEEFRFPAETRAKARKKPSLGLVWRILIWLVASLGVVGAFALLVNLILPGPPR